MEKVQHPQCFVYGLVDPATRLVFYVGQTIRGLSRPNMHRQKGWVFEIAILEAVDDPVMPSASLCPWLPTGRNPSLLNEIERYWVALGRALGWPLLNKTDGGDGMRVRGSPSTRAKMSASHKGNVHSEETKKKIAAVARDKAIQFYANQAMARLRAGWSAIRRSEQRRALWACIEEDRVTRARTSANRARRKPMTHCKWGHELTPENRSYRSCRQCAARRNAAQPKGLSHAESAFARWGGMTPEERIQKTTHLIKATRARSLAARKRAERDLTGKRFEMWLVLGGVEMRRRSMAIHCVCECGTKAVVAINHLKEGRTASCGCRSKSKTHCKNGHELNAQNTYVTKRGRMCKACRRTANAKYHRRRSSAGSVDTA